MRIVTLYECVRAPQMYFISQTKGLLEFVVSIGEKAPMHLSTPNI